MNTVHDMGGMQNFGPVEPEADEPMFHHPWEARVHAMNIAMGAAKLWNIDQGRYAIEKLPPAQYLAFSYYEKWFVRLQHLLVERGLVAQHEIQAGRATEAGRKIDTLGPERVAAALRNRRATGREPTSPARFKIGERVRTREMHPRTHTRLPFYCRDKPGTIAIVHGVHVFPDTNALGNENPQWLYGVRFEASQLWGKDTTAGAVYVDCFEPYLEPDR
jgi:nitrile hydratase beta subunit